MDTDDDVGMLIAEHGDRLLRVAFQLTHDRASAQDVGLRLDRADCQTAACESVIRSGRNFLT